MTNTTNSIADQINSFDFFYEFSDSNDVFQRGTKAKKDISAALATMSETALIKVKAAITASEDFVNRYFAAFFQNLPQELHTASPQTENTKGEQSHDNEVKPSQAQKTSHRREIFVNAWTMIRKGLFQTFGEALRAAWSRFKLVQSLRAGIAYFSFIKASGEVRDAIGTLAGNNFEYQSKGQRSTDKPELVKFWDVQARAFRSCRIDRLISIS